MNTNHSSGTEDEHSPGEAPMNYRQEDTPIDSKSSGDHDIEDGTAKSASENNSPHIFNEESVTDEGMTYHFLSDGKKIPAAPADHSDYEVAFLHDDLEHPWRWPNFVRRTILVLVAATPVAAASGSAIISGGFAGIMKEFHVGSVAATLTVSLFVAGFAVGPVLWGPLSELIGRRIPLLIGVFGMVVFAFASATAKDFQTLCLSRFFMGCFGAASVTIGPATLADLFNGKERGQAMAVVGLMITVGPMLAPVMGGYIGASYLGWRWTQYIVGIFTGAVLISLIFFLKETYPPQLLAQRAAIIREETGNWAVYAPQEKIVFDFREVAERTLAKPMIMLAVEPILLLLSVYHGLVYGILYLCLEAVPIIFGEKYGWKGGNAFLPYIAMTIGCFIVCFVNLWYFDAKHIRRLKASGRQIMPEGRLELMIVAGIAFPIGIFWTCWSGNYKVHWIVPMIGLVFLGFGLMGVFISVFNYIVDVYLMIAASAIAANTFVRSGFGAAFPLFARAMFHNLGVQWAGTLLGCLAVLLVPAPFIFFTYGARIRKKSKYAMYLDEGDGLPHPVSRSATASSQHVSRVVSRPKSLMAL